MRRRTIACAAGLAACAALTGCSLQDSAGFWSSAETRINAAFPLADPVRSNQAWLAESTAGAQQKDFAARFAARLKLRALNCAQGYAPSLLATAEDIRRKLPGAASCFAEADADLARWTGLLRAGLIMARPPLKPVPKTAPASIIADGFISAASFASGAPVALLSVSGQTVQVVDMETSKPLFREAASSSQIGQLSPNGRLFTVGENDRSRIRDAETGAVVVELPSVRPFAFHWLDQRTAVYNRSGPGGDKAFLVDFPSGKEVAIPWITGGMQRAVPVAGSDSQYVILSGNAVTRVAVDRGGVEPSVSLVADKQARGTYWALNTSGATADGTRYVGTAGNALKIVDLATLEVDSVAFEPFTLQLSSATPDPDKVVLTGFVSPAMGEGPKTLLYSIGQQALAPVDAAKVTSNRFLYVPSLRKIGVIADRRIDLLDSLPAGEEVPLARFAADMQDLANQRKLAAYEKQQSGVGIPFFPNAPLSDLARDAQVEGVGVYQGAAGAPAAGSRRMGYVEVRIRRSARPVILVLSSYEPVRWMLVSESGARLAAVLLSGYYQSQVVGAGNVRIISTGSAFAYKQESAEYQALSRDVARVVGKGIGLFQGRYEGSQFSVGGL